VADSPVLQELHYFGANPIEEIAPTSDRLDIDIKAARYALFGHSICDRFQNHEVFGYRRERIDPLVIRITLVVKRDDAANSGDTHFF
jgi:hypothetical protein